MQTIAPLCCQVNPEIYRAFMNTKPEYCVCIHCLLPICKPCSDSYFPYDNGGYHHKACAQECKEHSFNSIVRWRLSR